MVPEDQSQTAGTQGTQPDESYSSSDAPLGTPPPAQTSDAEGKRDMDDRAREQASEVAERARSTATQVADKAEELAPQARERAYRAVESGRESSAGVLDRAAAGLEDRAGDGGIAGTAAERTAEGMHAAAGYLREHETREIWDDVEHYVRAHPVQAVAAAVVTGIVVGRVLR
jgi:ElaB/YqjD/DUF883 family membrane-anchored ribosome-binding protein